VVETILFVIIISLLEFLCVDILGLPPFGGIGGG